MPTLRVEIQKSQLNPRSPDEGYFVSVLPVGGSPGVSIDTSFGCRTQEQAIAEVEKKLRLSFAHGDTVRFNGNEYLSVDEAVQAIRETAADWA